jgi:hypothetical protein
LCLKNGPRIALAVAGFFASVAILKVISSTKLKKAPLILILQFLLANS